MPPVRDVFAGVLTIMTKKKKKICDQIYVTRRQNALAKKNNSIAHLWKITWSLNY